MAKELALGDIEPAIEIFKQVNIKAVQKVLARAEQKALAAGRRQHGATKTALRPSKLGRALSNAMASHGRQSKDRPSIRMTAPDTGGRPYHFGFSVVTKGSRKEAPAAAAAKTGGGPQSRGTTAGGKRRRASTREGAHQLYTERDAPLDVAEDLDFGGDAAALVHPSGAGRSAAARASSAVVGLLCGHGRAQPRCLF